MSASIAPKPSRVAANPVRPSIAVASVIPRPPLRGRSRVSRYAGTPARAVASQPSPCTITTFDFVACQRIFAAA